MNFFSEERANELRAIFFESAHELLQALNEEGLRLETSPADSEIVRDIRRTVHTLKGDSAACGYQELSELAHALEDVLTPEIAGRSGAALAELVLSAADVFEAFLSAYGSGMQPPSGEALRAMVQRVMHPEESQEPSQPAPAFAWNEYERLVIAKSQVPGNAVNVGLVMDQKCAMPVAALQMVWRVLRESGTVLVSHPEIDSNNPVAVIEAVLATEQTAEWVCHKCNVPGIIGAAYVEPYSPDETGKKKENEAADGGAENGTENTENNDGALAAVLESAKPEAPTPGPVEVKWEQPKAERPLQATENLLRVDAERIDAVLDLVGELIIIRSTMQQILLECTKKWGRDPLRTRFADTLAKQSQVMYNLQRSVMKIRMVPVEQLFRRFPRVVRDLAKMRNKDVQMVIKGENTDLDKSILDALAEPLTHLVRNAVDHGIEDSVTRQQAGKTAQGTVQLDAYHQGNQIVIEISDDGGGIDPELVLAKAVDKGLLSAEQAEQLSAQDAINLIFEPGFSTAEEITEISGRGVGMDIVRAVIHRLKGSISTHSERGVGTTFRLRLPLTLAIIKALLFYAGDRLYAVPLGNVLEITRVFADDIHVVEEQEVLQVREESIPLIRVDEITGGRARETRGAAEAASGNGNKRGKYFVIVVSVAENKYGLAVERLAGEEELVIKALDDHLVATDLVGGASVLGNGRVVLILNLSATVDRIRKKQISGRTQVQAANA